MLLLLLAQPGRKHVKRACLSAFPHLADYHFASANTCCGAYEGDWREMFLDGNRADRSAVLDWNMEAVGDVGGGINAQEDGDPEDVSWLKTFFCFSFVLLLWRRRRRGGGVASGTLPTLAEGKTKRANDLAKLVTCAPVFRSSLILSCLVLSCQYTTNTCTVPFSFLKREKRRKKRIT